MGSYEDYLAKRRKDPEYRETERSLKPILDLADTVFELRMERGWTQAELAKKVGTRQSNISRLENGTANPTIKFLKKVARAFEVELEVRLSPKKEKVQKQPSITYHFVEARKPCFFEQETTPEWGTWGTKGAGKDDWGVSNPIFTSMALEEELPLAA